MHEQGYVEDKKLISASNQILHHMDITGVNSPLIGKNTLFHYLNSSSSLNINQIVSLAHSMKGAR
jgi:hypothetical protein